MSDISLSEDQNTGTEVQSPSLSKPRTNWFSKAFGAFGKKEEAQKVSSQKPRLTKNERITKRVFKEMKFSEDLGKTKGKLNADQVMKIVFWIATFVKPAEIVENVREEFGISIHPQLVQYYKNREEYQPVIQKIRDRWGSDLLHVELANKRRRMEELERIYDHCMNTDQIKNALSALYQIKGEVEKDLQNISSQTNYQINIYKDLTETELEEERLKSLERLKTLKGEITHIVEPVKEIQNG